MRVERKDTNKETTFGSIPDGRIFIYRDDVYLKMEEEDYSTYSRICQV